MSQVNGQLTTCERCGEQIFRKTIGEGEADGGFTRWNKFEPYPDGWDIVSVPNGYAKFNNIRVCPKCKLVWDRALIERFINGTPLEIVREG